MDLSKYLQYSAVTSPIVLAIIFLSLTFKSWLDRRTVNWTLRRAAKMQKEQMKEIFGDDKADFDEHVESTPGMRIVK